MERMQAWRLAGKKLCLISILRAGNGILDGLLDLVPSARIGHVGRTVTLKRWNRSNIT